VSSRFILNVKHLPHYAVSHSMVTAFRISNFTVQNEVKEFNTQNVLMYIITLNIALSESHINLTFR